MDLSELPQRLHRHVVEDGLFWEIYKPKAAPELEVPFGKDWWKYVYWIPKMKKRIYAMIISKTNAEVDHYFYTVLGMDEEWFRKNYKEFIQRLEWMRKNFDYSQLGEL